MTEKPVNQEQVTKGPSGDGSFKPPPSTFRNRVETGGQHPPEAGRYHLYISHPCPWANRTAIVRKLKGLEQFIDVTILSPYFGSLGWAFKSAAEKEIEGVDDDPVSGAKNLREIYFKANPEYAGRFTVPCLWDKKANTIVNNESAEIIRIFNEGFNDLLPEPAKLDLYPEHLRDEIDQLNAWVYETVNSGVYKAGFATTQEAYDAAVVPLFQSLDRLEALLKGKDYLVGNQLTEADVRLFTTMIRFDVAYYGHFKCNLRNIRHDYPEINRWMKALYWNNPAFNETVNFDHIRQGYHWSQTQVNPTRVVPIGPKVNIEPL